MSAFGIGINSEPEDRGPRDQGDMTKMRNGLENGLAYTKLGLDFKA